GRIIPVCDVSERLVGRKLTSRRFYLIAKRVYNNRIEWMALPVTGECELITSDMTPASDSDSPHVKGWLSHGGDVIEVLSLVARTPSPAETPAQKAQRFLAAEVRS